MKLRFYARGDALVTVPGVQPQIGQSLPRVGRTNVHTPAEVLDEYHAKAGVKPGFLVPPATRDAYEVDSESPAGQRLKKLIRREPCLWAADAETADECGVPFVDLKFVNDSWVPENPEGAE